MGADQSVHKPDVDSAGIASWDSRCSAADEEAPSPQREKTHDEYRHTIWLHDELTRERRLHRGISENIVLEDFRRDLRDFYIVDNDSVLGRGCTGSVRLCTRITTGVRYALKTLRVDNMTPESKKKFHQEISIMTKLDHPNILRLHEYFETDTKVYLVLDLCHGGELLDYLNGQYRHHFDEGVVRRYVKQIVGAVVYLHEHGIVHRDLKLENFLLETKDPDSEIKLIDFGLSTYVDKHGTARDSVGTPFYVAPEVLSGPYNNKCDVWSIGVITYMMLCGRPPFFGTTDQLILRAVEAQPVDYSHRRFAHVSVTAIDFVAACLDRDTKSRPTASVLLDHPFFKDSPMNASADRPAPKPSFNVLQKLNYFLRRPLFYKLCLEAVAFSLSPDQISSLRDQFHAYDTNNTGYIGIENLHCMMAGLNLFYRVPDSAFFPGDDEHEDEHRQISYHEFIAATTSLQTVTEENIKVAFDLLSAHGSYIELETITNFLGAEARGRRVVDILAAANLSAEGRMDYDQFKQFLITEYQRAMRYDGFVPAEADGALLNHSVKTYKKHSHFMSLLKHAGQRIKGAEVEDVQQRSFFKHSDGSEVHHHHSSHM